jgi:hypothetical protein
MSQVHLLSIANKALFKIGQNRISSLTQAGKEADKCNSAIRDVLREVIEEHAWGFATKYATLAKLQEAPPFGFEFAYQAPQEALRLLDVRSVPDLTAKPEKHVLVSGNIVYTDANPCYARYVIYTEDLGFAPAGFIDTVAWKLAAEIAPSLAKSNLTSQMLQGYEFALDKARTSDDSNNLPRRTNENLECKFLTARGYGYNPDNEGGFA